MTQLEIARQLGDRPRAAQLFREELRATPRRRNARCDGPPRHVVVGSQLRAFARDNLFAFGFSCFCGGALFTVGAAYVWSFYL